MPRISCAMIVRNAEATLPVALQSVREHVDQLVVLDTGSTDGTKDIAMRYADIVSQKMWRDHFAEMREEAFSLCDGDWILHLDADDELMHGRHLHDLVAATPSEVGAYLLDYVTEMDKAGNPSFHYMRERLVRRGWYRWVGRVHEVLEPIAPHPYRRFEDTWVLHRGHGDGLGSLNRNIRLLRLALAEEPHNARALFYLGRDLVQLGQLEEALPLLDRYLGVSNWPDEAFMARLLIGHIYRVRGQFSEAYGSDLQLLNLKPLWPQGYFALAEDCYYLKAWAESVHFSEIGQRLPLPETNLFLAPEAIRTAWMIYQVVALHQLGRVSEAADLTNRALSLLPDNAMHRDNARFYAGMADAPSRELLAASAAQAG